MSLNLSIENIINNLCCQPKEGEKYITAKDMKEFLEKVDDSTILVVSTNEDDDGTPLISADLGLYTPHTDYIGTILDWDTVNYLPYGTISDSIQKGEMINCITLFPKLY